MTIHWGIPKSKMNQTLTCEIYVFMKHSPYSCECGFGPIDGCCGPKQCPGCGRPLEKEYMNAHTFDYTDKLFYEEIWNLLVKEVGARSDPIDKKMFVLDFCQIDNPAIEFRFGGTFGMGGKFWRNGDHFEISCYRETETPERLEVIARVNAEINQLVEKHHPRNQYDLMKLGWRF